MSLFASGSARGPRLFFARYDGTCNECGNEFEAGERIGYDSDDEICCEDCLSGDSPTRAPAPSRVKAMKVCQDCLMVHAGSCF